MDKDHALGTTAKCRELDRSRLSQNIGRHVDAPGTDANERAVPLSEANLNRARTQLAPKGASVACGDANAEGRVMLDVEL
jgi:hypothetical protein